MKKLLLSIFIIQLGLCGYAQLSDDSLLQKQSYLFDHFIDGTVRLKSGEISQAPLNYCASDQTILFEKGNQVMTLVGLEFIDTIYIGGKKFVPLNKAIYEVVSNTGKVALLLSYSTKMKPLEATSDHNGTTKKSSNEVSNTISNVYVTRKYKGDYSLEVIKSYWLKNYNDLHKANNLKDFLKVFKENTNPSISDYINKNNVNFKNESDMIKLVDFCNKQ